jgi:hypothetical protein
LLQVFAWAAVLSLIPSLIYAELGGDEGFEKRHPKAKKLLHVIHHYMLGLALLNLSLMLQTVGLNGAVPDFLCGFGFGLAFEDLTFHVHENYFARKYGDGNNTDPGCPA